MRFQLVPLSRTISLYNNKKSPRAQQEATGLLRGTTAELVISSSTKLFGGCLIKIGWSRSSQLGGCVALLSHDR